MVGASVAAKSPPDGQTWMITFDSHILNPAFAPQPALQGLRAACNVMQIGRTPQTIAAHPDRPYKTFAEVVADAKARPGKVSIGVLGASQALVLADAASRRRTTSSINLIPYKGGGPLDQDLLAGVTDIAHRQPGLAQPALPRQQDPADRRHRREARTPALPDTPTLVEQGIKAYPVLLVVGRLCAGRHARPIVERMHAEIAKAVRSPDVTQKFVEQFNMEILTSSPEVFAAFQKGEQERWAQGHQGKRHQGRLVAKADQRP